MGVAGAVAVRLIVYSKGKNATKYRKGEEYGSARWGTAKDIAPYIDPKSVSYTHLTQMGMFLASKMRLRNHVVSGLSLIHI